MKKILVIQTAFIGDVILATPVLEALHAAHPDAKIDVLVRKGNQDLFTGHPFLRQVLLWDKLQGKTKNLLLLLLAIRRQRYDLVVNCHRFASSGLLTALSKARVKIGFKKNPWSFAFNFKIEHSVSAGQHECERNLSLLKPLHITGIAQPKLYPPAMSGLPEEAYVCIAPASVWYTKQWPVDKWKELIRALGKSKRIILMGAPSDKALCEEVIRGLEDYRLDNKCGQFRLLESATVMKHAEMNYVNDSAPMHLCSAVDAPVTAIYCSTIPEFGFGPLSSKSFIAQTTDELDCRPCGLHGHRACPRGHFACAETIQVKEMLHSIS